MEQEKNIEDKQRIKYLMGSLLIMATINSKKGLGEKASGAFDLTTEKQQFNYEFRHIEALFTDFLSKTIPINNK